MSKNLDKFYENVAQKIGWDFSMLNCEKEILTDFNFWGEIRKFAEPQSIVLDSGCGSGEKTLKHLTAKKVYCIDYEKEMLKKARINLANYPEKQDMFEFLKMDCFGKLDFDDDYFDLVISRHCGINFDELYRVLKSGGKYISRDIAKRDCWDIKVMFGRGQGYDNEPCDSEGLLETKFEQLGFSSVEKFDIVEIEYYNSKEDLVFLLMHTPIIDNFGQGEKDHEILDNYIKVNTTKKGIKLERKLYGFILKK